MGRYLQRGNLKVYFVPTIAAGNMAPTVAEITAGTLLSVASGANALSAIDGFNVKADFIETPHFGARQTPKIPGEIKFDDSSLTFYEDDTSNPVRTLLAQDVSGYIVIGKLVTASSKVNVFPVQVSSNTPQYTAGNEAATFKVDFAVTDVPAQQVTVAA